MGSGVSSSSYSSPSRQQQQLQPIRQGTHFATMKMNRVGARSAGADSSANGTEARILSGKGKNNTNSKGEKTKKGNSSSKTDGEAPGRSGLLVRTTDCMRRMDNKDGEQTQARSNPGRTWAALRQGMEVAKRLPRKTLTLADFKTIHRQKTVEEEENTRVDIPYKIDKEVESDPLCFVCSVYTGSETYPCRICPHVYHESCLRTIGQCQDAASAAQLLNAHTDTGWSCPNCDSLNNLLTEEEMSELMDNFEKTDINGDASISMEELLHFKEQQCQLIEGRSLTAEEITMVRDEFRIMDCDNTNSIDHWEFLNYESVKLLEKRTKNALTRLLTEMEIDRARKTFQYFDLDGNGLITTAEATKAYYKWYEKFLTKSKAGGDVMSRVKTRDLDEQVVKSVKRLMSMNSTEESVMITWSEYIREQALYILAARPNNTNMHLKATEKARKCDWQSVNDEDASES